MSVNQHPAAEAAKNPREAMIARILGLKDQYKPGVKEYPRLPLNGLPLHTVVFIPFIKDYYGPNRHLRGGWFVECRIPSGNSRQPLKIRDDRELMVYRNSLGATAPTGKDLLLKICSIVGEVNDRYPLAPIPGPKKAKKTLTEAIDLEEL